MDEIPGAMRVPFDGSEWRYRSIQQARREIYGEKHDGQPAGNKADTVGKACLYLHEHADDLREALEHPDMTEELAEILDHGIVPVRYSVERFTAVGTDAEE